MIFFLGKISGCWSIIIVFHFCPKLILCLCFFQLNTGFVKINSGAKVIGQIYWMVHSAVFKNRENRRRKNRNNIGWCIQYLWENRRKLFWKKLKWRHWKSKNIVRLYKLFSQGGDYFQVCPCFAGDTVVCVGKKYTKGIKNTIQEASRPGRRSSIF